MFSKSCRQFLVTTGIAISAVASAATASLAAPQDFWVHNQTRSTMTSLWIAPIDYSGEVSDALNYTVPSGDASLIVFPNNQSECVFDIRADFSNGTYKEYENVNLCSTSDLAF